VYSKVNAQTNSDWFTEVEVMLFVKHTLLADLTNEKFGAAAQKVLVPTVLNMIKKFMKEKKLNEDFLMDAETKPLVGSITDLLSRAKLPSNAAILSIFTNLQLALEEASLGGDDHNSDNSNYNTTKLVNRNPTERSRLSKNICN
jgi:hypothetical protein